MAHSKPTDLPGLSDRPNLGKKKLKFNFKAGDDAAAVCTVRVEDIAYGRKAMPFLHVWFALLHYRDKLKNMRLAKLFELAFKFSRLRNIRLIRKVNVKLAAKGLVCFDITSEMEELEKNLQHYIEEAIKRGFDYSKYLDESNDDDDIDQCTNDWCCKQNTEPGKASDNVVVITDCDGVDWFVLIVRKNGPGRHLVAWAGGFVDPYESFEEAADRELDEEIKMQVPDVNFHIIKNILEPIIWRDWDPRAKFPFGMVVGATVTHYIFTRTRH
jgi:hypothetical protein